MKNLSVTLLVAAAVLMAITVHASGPVVVYAMIEKVALEPNESAPQRIQIWGAFSLKQPYEGVPGERQTEYSAVQRGYLYYKIDLTSCSNSSVASCVTDREKATRAVWADMKKLVGKAVAVGFGDDEPFWPRVPLAKVRKSGEKPESPDLFPLGNPVIVLGASQTDVVAKLRAAFSKE